MLCDFLGVDFKVKPIAKDYSHGWKNNALDAKPIVCSLKVLVMNSNGKTTVIKFDLIEGSAPLIVCLNIQRYAMIDDDF